MIILASTSATRQKILRNAGVPFTIMPPCLDENAARSTMKSMTPQDQAKALAKLKAQAVSKASPDHIIIGADQILELDGKIYGKPASMDEAFQQLSELQGKRHQLHSAAVIISNNIATIEILQTATLRMRRLDGTVIANYLALAGPDILNAVGCYHIEGLGIQLFDDIKGDVFSIMGLPLLPLLSHLRQQGHIAS
jgi:septum formation protein